MKETKKTKFEKAVNTHHSVKTVEFLNRANTTENEDNGDTTSNVVETMRYGTAETVKTVQKQIQKQRQKKRNAEAYRKRRQHNFTDRLKHGVKEFLSNPAGFLVKKSTAVGVFAGLIIGIIVSLPTLVTTGGIGAAIVGGETFYTTYQSAEADILAVEGYYSALEETLSIKNYESNYPLCDAYDISRCCFSHDAHDLAAIFTVILGMYSIDNTSPVCMETINTITMVFEMQYHETVWIENTTKHSDTEDVPWTICHVTVTQQSLHDVAEMLLSESQKKQYDALRETKGNMPDIFQ